MKIDTQELKSKSTGNSLFEKLRAMTSEEERFRICDL
jgi:hypothetical protein